MDCDDMTRKINLKIRQEHDNHSWNVQVDMDCGYYELREVIADMIHANSMFKLKGVDDHSLLTRDKNPLEKRLQVTVQDFGLQNGSELILQTGSKQITAKLVVFPGNSQSKDICFNAIDTVSHVIKTSVRNPDLRSILRSDTDNMLIFKTIYLEEDKPMLKYNVNDSDELQIMSVETIQVEELPKLTNTKNYYLLNDEVLRKFKSNDNTNDALDERKQMFREIIAYLRIDLFTHIVKYRGFYKIITGGKTKFYVATEYLKQGSVRDYLNSKNGGLSDAEAITIIKQVLLGLEELHKWRIIHRNLKCSNILFVDKTLLTVKISDLAKSKTYMSQSVHHSIGQTFSQNKSSEPESWWAPEMLQTENVGTPADIWMVGITFHEMLTGSSPFCGWTKSKIIRHFDEEKVVPHTHLGVIKTFLDGCFHYEPHYRKTISELLDILK